MDVIGTYLESALGQNEQLIFMKISQGRQTGREGLQNLKELVRAQAGWKTLEQDNCQILQENRLQSDQRRSLHTCIQEEKATDHC